MLRCRSAIDVELKPTYLPRITQFIRRAVVRQWDDYASVRLLAILAALVSGRKTRLRFPKEGSDDPGISAEAVQKVKPNFNVA
jgi:hypothetical protein